MHPVMHGGVALFATCERETGGERQPNRRNGQN
jgi:hypothetical protein